MLTRAPFRELEMRRLEPPEVLLGQVVFRRNALLPHRNRTAETALSFFPFLALVVTNLLPVRVADADWPDASGAFARL
jgi:hypothetical protein